MKRTRTTRSVLALTAASLAISACGSGTATPAPSDSERPTLGATPLDSPTSGATGTPEPAPSGSASPSAEPSPEPHDPTDTDRARFISTYQPQGSRDLEAAQVDVDGDGTLEIVFTYVRSSEGVSHIGIAWWDGFVYDVTWGADGGPADDISARRISDVNGDGRTEIALFQRRGSSGASMSIWRSPAVGSHTLEPLVAREGCANGSNTYGVVGAELEDRDGDGRSEIYATCDDSPLPVAAWATAVYVWRDDAYRFDRTQP